MPEEQDLIYDSPASEPDDAFWLEQGRKMVAESLASVREAAKAFITGLQVIVAIYLGILGFAPFVPETITTLQRVLFVGPLVFWLIALYFCIRVMMTSRIEVLLDSPSDIREKSSAVLEEKQRQLLKAFGFLAAGLLLVVVLLLLRLGL